MAPTIRHKAWERVRDAASHYKREIQRSWRNFIAQEADINDIQVKIHVTRRMALVRLKLHMRAKNIGAKLLEFFCVAVKFSCLS